MLMESHLWWPSPFPVSSDFRMEWLDYGTKSQGSKGHRKEKQGEAQNARIGKKAAKMMWRAACEGGNARMAGAEGGMRKGLWLL